MVSDLRSGPAALAGSFAWHECAEFVLAGRVCCDRGPATLLSIYDSICDAASVF